VLLVHIFLRDIPEQPAGRILVTGQDGLSVIFLESEASDGFEARPLRVIFELFIFLAYGNRQLNPTFFPPTMGWNLTTLPTTRRLLCQFRPLDRRVVFGPVFASTSMAHTTSAGALIWGRL